MHQQPASIWSLAAFSSGDSWRLQADDLRGDDIVKEAPVGTLPEQGDSAGSLAQTPTPGVLWQDDGQYGPTRSTDGGHVFAFVNRWDGPTPSIERVGAHVQFVDAEHGWCLFDEAGGLWRTSDGGQVWSELGQ
jgi:hypothetical protein